MRRGVVLLLGLALLAAAACAPGAPATPTPTPTPSPTPGPSPTPTPGELAGGILATFESQGQRFRVWVTNPSTIEQVLALQRGESRASIPNGRILRGPGQGDHNAPWSWHLDPQDVEMAEATIEVCDGAPQYVEDNLDEFVDTVGRYCPWGAKLVGVEDYR